MSQIFLAAGGDLRFASLAELLNKEGKVYAMGFDKYHFSDPNIISISSADEMPEKADVLILPIPPLLNGYINTPYSSKDIPLSEAAAALRDGGKVFCGGSADKLKEVFNANVFNYLEREEFAVSNALATAEGALQIALEEQPRVITGENVLITGMGRIARSLIRVLSGFGCSITVAARKESDLAWAEILGCRGVRIDNLMESGVLSQCGLVFNTVPVMILTKKHLLRCRKDCLIIDLASRPGGVDFEGASELGTRAVWALSLPGRTAPLTAAQIIHRTINGILNEESFSP